MNFARAWARVSVRRHLLGLVAIAVLLTLVGGLALVAVAGARRTQSSYTRFLASKNPSHLVVDVGSVRGEDAAILDDINGLPQVVSAKAYAAFYVAEWVDGAPDFEHDFEALGSLDGRFFDQDVFTPVRGRQPDPARADEIAVNEDAARRYGYHVGQQIDLATVSEEDLSDPAFAENPKPRLLTHATIVGVGAFIEEVVQDDTDKSPLVLLTPAFSKQAAGLETYAWDGLVLRNGTADVAAVKQKIIEESGPTSPQIFREPAIDQFHAIQSMRPISLALGVFGLIAALAAIVLVGQAIGRHVRAEREERAVARAIGAAPGMLRLATAIGPVAAVVIGALGAAVVAVLASPLMPIGPVRRVEVDRGIDIDWTVIGLGTLLFVVVLAAVTAVEAVVESPHRLQRRTDGPRERSGFVERVRALPVAMTTGLRLALEPGEGVSAVPVRSVIAGTAIAVAALVAALTFGAGMRHLVTHPAQYGWSWDVAVLDNSGYGNTDTAAAREILGGDPDIAAWSGAFFGADVFDGVNVPLLGMPVGSEVVPPITEGRMIEREDEVVFGTATLDRLHKHVGNTVTTGSGDLTIVGAATLPAVSQVHGDHTSLGIGAIIGHRRNPGWDRNCGAPGTSNDPVTLDQCGPNVLFIRFRAGADKAAVTKRLDDVAQQLSPVPDAESVTILRPQRSAEIQNADDIGGSSTLLGGAVAFASLVALAVALTSAVRRRRRDLALLKSLGFTRRQLTSAVAWQATGTVAVGVLIGVPSGVLVGRALWTQFAEQLDVLAQPVTPVLACAVVIVGAVVAANVLAVVPARVARRVPVSLVLRRE
jgi:hypothetical protein